MAPHLPITRARRGSRGEPPGDTVISRADSRLTFHGNGGTLFGITVVNVLLSVGALGLYAFWGKTRVRQYTHGQMAFAGDRFAHRADGLELLVGFLKAMSIFAPFVGALSIAAAVPLNPVVVAVVQLGLAARVLVVIPVAVVGSRK